MRHLTSIHGIGPQNFARKTRQASGVVRSVRDLEDTLGIRQPGLFQQIAELRDAGLIVGRKESKNMFYRLADGRVTEFIGLMFRMFCKPAGR